VYRERRARSFQFEAGTATPGPVREPVGTTLAVPRPCPAFHNPEVTQMLRNTLAITFIGALTWSCASAPPRAPASPAASPKPAATAASGTSPTPSLASGSQEHRELKAGECEESFDCVDTIGFPPAGHRWTCENGKCGRAKLPDLNPEASSAAAEASADASKDQPTVRKTKKHDN
jgi:hypothetical protein